MPTPINLSGYGAVGNGVADDTAALRAALASGKSVVDNKGGTYRVTGPLPLTGGQEFLGAGAATTFKPDGSFDLFQMLGARSRVRDVTIDGALHTGGRTFFVNGAHRGGLENIVASSPMNLLHVQGTNTFEWRSGWAGNCRGQHSVRVYGTGNYMTGLRTDIVTLTHVVLSANAADKPIGLDVDGNVGTVFLNNAAFLAGHGTGVWVRNTSGAGTDNPQFLEWTQLNLENSERGLIVDVPGYHEGVNLYCSGMSAGDGVRTSANAFVKIANAIVANISGIGLNAGAGTIMAGNVHSWLCSGGDQSGTVFLKAPGRLEIDATCRLMADVASAQMVFDANDYMLFNRGADRWSMIVNGTETLFANGADAGTNVPFWFPPYTVATLPSPGGLNGRTIRVGDRNNRLATSDGAAWRWAGDGTVVS
jgi:hypothetical protein